MALTWDFYLAGRGSKIIEVFTTRPDPYTAAYGPVFTYDDLPLIEYGTITAQNPPIEDVEAEKAKCRLRNTAQTYTLADGTTITGKPYSYSYKEMDALPLYELSIELIRTDV